MAISAPWRSISFDHISDLKGFWAQRLQVVTRTTAQLCLDKCEATGRLANFRRAAGREEGGFQGIYFNDSDVYKILEGIAYLLADQPDEALAHQAEAIIDDICAAQWEDGYINTYYSLTDRSQRWTDMGMHEDYCIGHMIEAAIAYYHATGRDKWLRCAVRAAEHMMSLFGPGLRHWVVGHQGLELALVKLSEVTGRTDFLDFARWLVEERGHGHLDAASFRQQGLDSVYCQDDLPASQLRRVTGHAVRAMYYYSAMSDLAALQDDQALREAVLSLHRNTVPANMYVTGGIGQDSRHEGFTRDYHLPNLTAYCETCAAIGMAMWHQRLNLLEGEGSYADIVELELYNGALAGLSLSGDLFFYDNPLASVGKTRRRPWFDCSCCPTNLMRFLPSVAGYAYAQRGDSLMINQYIAGTLSLGEGSQATRLVVQTDYPWDGRVSISLEQAGGLSELRLRIPGWCEHWQVNGKQLESHQGYVSLPLNSGLVYELTLDMPVRRLRQDERVQETAGRVAFARGPIVYCAEEMDYPGYVREYFHADVRAPKKEPRLVPGQGVLEGMHLLQFEEGRLIPYFAWNNRDQAAMAVWLKED